MKNSLIVALTCHLFIAGFSQNPGYEYSGRFTPAIKKEKLNEARFISEVMPKFSQYFSLPYKERDLLNQQLELISSPNGAYAYPQENFMHSQQNYEKLMEYVSIEISAISHGKPITAQSTSEVLTAEQKSILNTADLGTDISIKIKFKYKYSPKNNFSDGTKIREGEYSVTVVPETEAQYPGGFKQISDYLTKNIINKIPGKNAPEKIQQAIVKFTVNEEGQVIDAKLFKRSADPKIDKLILDATKNMPKWKPAKNSKGITVKQEFNIPFGGGGC